MKVKNLEIVDDSGHSVIELGASRGLPYVVFRDRQGRIRLWATLEADGQPDVRFFRSRIEKRNAKR